MAKKARRRRQRRSGGEEAAAAESPAPAPTRPRRRAAAWLALLAAAAAGLWLWRPGSGAAELRREAGLDVLLVTIDTLRADALGSYGRAAAETPWMDRLAGAGVRFENAYAHNVVTLPSHANILSGRHPQDHGVRDNSGFRFPGDAETLATLLRGEGYRTGAFVSAFPLDSRFGLDRGFDVYEDGFVDVDTSAAFVYQERRGAETVELARRWLDGGGGRPSFCWLHLYDPHFPYEPPEPFASRHAREPYHGEVAATDAALGPLLEPLLEAGEAGRTLVVLTADHGEALGDHGESTHGIFAYDPTLRVPLVLYAPRLLAPRVVATAARHVDLLPTVLDALALEPPPGLPGRSLLPAAAGRDLPGEPAYFEALTGALFRGWAPLHGVVSGGYKLIELPIPELYDLSADPGETRNLASREPERMRELRDLLGRLREGDPGARPAAESTETLQRLRALGYLGGEAAPAREEYGEEDDPKRLIQLDAMLHEAVGRYRDGDLPGAMALCRELVARRPDMPAALVQLGFLQREAGELGAAIDSLRRALALRPSDSNTQSLLGVYLNEAGRPAETAALLEPLAAGDVVDVDVLAALGAAQAQLGRREDALATFARARELDPSNAMTAVNVGTVHLMAGDLERAQRHFEEALGLDPDLARAHNSLGVVAARRGRADEAIERWKRAVALNPSEYDTLYNLGVLLRQQGRAGEARPYLERFLREAPPARYGDDLVEVRRWLAHGEGR